MKSLSFLPATLSTLFLFASLPFITKWREVFSPLFSSNIFPTSLLTLSAVCGIGTVIFFWKRVSNRNGIRFTLLLTGAGIIFALMLSVKNPIERIHVLEYGLLAFLWYLPFRKNHSGLSAFFITSMVALNLGIADEWIQHFLPDRVADLGDVWLNGASVIAVLLMTLALDRNETFRSCSIDWVPVLKSGALSILSLAAFITGITHKGYRHDVKPALVFFSKFTLDEIRTKDSAIIKTPSEQISLQDKYPDKMHAPEFRSQISPFHLEFLTHLFRRDRYDSKGKTWIAYKENQILAKYFPVTLKIMKRDWRVEKLEGMKTKLSRTNDKTYISPVSRGELWVHGYLILWTGTMLLAGIFWALAYRMEIQSKFKESPRLENDRKTG